MAMKALPILLSRDTLLPAESNSAPIFDDFPPVRLFKVPDAAPPFDGEVLSGELPHRAPRSAGHDALRVPPPPRMPAPRTDMVTASGAGGLGDWPPRFARLLTEVLSGSRPAGQIMPWLTRRARFHLRRLTPAFNSGQRPRVVRVLASQPSAAVVEMSVIVGSGTRTRALALRLERTTLAGQPDRWMCTDIEAA
jgi:hypothetical protein